MTTANPVMDKPDQQLLSEQRPLLGLLLIIVSTVLVGLAMPAVSVEDPILVAFFLPAFVAGALAKFVGRFVQMHLRIIAGAIVFVIVLSITYAHISLPMALATAGLNGLICWAVAIRKPRPTAPTANT